MSLSDELRKLQGLHNSGALTDEEFAAAKARVIDIAGNEPATDVEAVRQQVLQLSIDNAVAQLDRHWELERERFMVWGKYGRRAVPTRGMSIIGGVIIAGFGLFWTAMAFTITANAGGPAQLFPLFGLLFIIGGVATSAYTYSKAVQFEKALEDYRRRREQLLNGQPDQGKDEAPDDPSSHANSY